MTNYNERPVQGFEGLYSVSRSGLVISHKRTTTNERILKQMSQEKIGNLYGVSQDLVYLLHNGKVRIFI